MFATFVDSTGTPSVSASIITFPNDSCFDGKTNKSAFFKYLNGFVWLPKRVTFLFNFNSFISDSKLGMNILENTPILSNLVDDTVKVYADVWDVVKNRGDLSDKEINTFVLATLLDNKLISIESTRKLVESNYLL